MVFVSFFLWIEGLVGCERVLKIVECNIKVRVFNDFLCFLLFGDGDLDCYCRVFVIYKLFFFLF